MRLRGRPFITDNVYSPRSPDILGILDRIDVFTRSPAHQMCLVLNFNVIADFTATDPTLAVTSTVSNYIKIEWNRLCHFTVQECERRCRSMLALRVSSLGKAAQSCSDSSMASGQTADAVEQADRRQ
jgi:hypothetical protein